MALLFVQIQLLVDALPWFSHTWEVRIEKVRDASGSFVAGQKKINVLFELFGCCCITKENRKSNKEEMLACNPTVRCLNQNSDRKDGKSSQNYLKCITLIPVRVGCELLRYACLYTFVCLSAGMSQHEVSSC